jgi:hypothetical protein
MSGSTIYNASGQVQVGARPTRPGGNPAWADWHIELDQTLTASHFGNDSSPAAPQRPDLRPAGQRHDQGDGSILGKVVGGNPVAAARRQPHRGVGIDHGRDASDRALSETLLTTATTTIEATPAAT